MNGSPDSGSSSSGRSRENGPSESVGRMQGLTADVRARVVSLSRPIGLAFLVAVIGAVIAIVASHRSSHPRSTSNPVVTNTTPVRTTTPTVAATTTPTVSATTPARTHPKPKPTPRPKPVRPKPAPANPAVAVWPAGKSGYSIVLASLPVSRGSAAAAARARAARNAGLRKVGVLDSGRYASLNPGYYVVFAGIYDTEAQAGTGIAAARAAGFPGAYVRRIAR
jgi:hypothetical protein